MDKTNNTKNTEDKGNIDVRNRCKKFWFDVSVAEKAHRNRAESDDWNGKVAVSLRNGGLVSTAIGVVHDITIGKITKFMFGRFILCSLLLGVTAGAVEYHRGWQDEASMCRSAARKYMSLRHDVSSLMYKNPLSHGSLLGKPLRALNRRRDYVEDAYGTVYDDEERGEAERAVRKMPSDRWNE